MSKETKREIEAGFNYKKTISYLKLQKLNLGLGRIVNEVQDVY